MEGLLVILGFCIVFILPVIVFFLLITIHRSTRDKTIQLDRIQSRIDALLATNKIDLSNLVIPRSLAPRIESELALIGGRSRTLSIIEVHLGVNRNQAQAILDRYISENKIEPLSSEEKSSEDVSA